MAVRGSCGSPDAAGMIHGNVTHASAFHSPLSVRNV
jgi:hypothetical protein